MTMIAPTVWTEAELLALPHDGYKYELVDGDIHIMSPAGPDHGVVCVNIASLLREFCRSKRLGVVMDGQAGFYMKNGDMFSPDVSFVSAVRWKSLPVERRRKFFRGLPDLAVEVLSPTEPRRHIERKVRSYLENNTALAWVVDPVTHSVFIHRPNATPEQISGRAVITGDPVLPGFSVVVSDLFEDADAL